MENTQALQEMGIDVEAEISLENVPLKHILLVLGGAMSTAESIGDDEVVDALINACLWLSEEIDNKLVP